MSKTNQERQTAYRKQRPTAGPQGDGEKRLNTWVNVAASLALARLAAHHKVSKREMLERLIVAADDGILGGLELDSAEWKAYFGVTA